MTDSPSLGRYQRLRGIVHAMEGLIFAGYRSVAKHNVDPKRHSVLISECTYSPWNIDREFRDAYDKVRGHTLVHVAKLYGLFDYGRQLRRLEGDVLEVGVWRGGTGALLAMAMKAPGNTPKVFLCDTYEGMPATTGAKDSFYKGGELADTSVELVRSFVEGLGLDNVVLCKGLFPAETERLVTSNKFKFVHIDVDIYSSARETVEWVWDKLVVGGMIVFDDYGYSATEGVTRLIDEELRNRPDMFFVFNTAGHGIIIKTR